MVGILAQVDDIFSWAPRGGKLIGTRWGMRIQGHGYLNILCRCNIRRSARGQRERGFLLDQPYAYDWGDSENQDRGHLGKIARTAPPDAHDAQLSNGSIGASIRVREVPFNNVNCSHLTAHSFGVESQARARSR